jgi:hypothetical protein
MNAMDKQIRAASVPSAAQEAAGAHTTAVGAAPASTPNAPPIIRQTWGKTGSPIAKIQKASGKWPLTPGATAKTFSFEMKEYRDLTAYGADYLKRQQSQRRGLGCGGYALVPGVLDPSRDETKQHPRNSTTIVDAERALFTIDFDGLEPDPGGCLLDTPSAFKKEVLEVALSRLPKAFRVAAKILLATASTGLPINSKGQPAAGRAWFRIVVHLSRPLTCAEQKRIAEALKTLPGLSCIDLLIYSPPQWEFVARPEFTGGWRNDPIKDPVIWFDGDPTLDVDALLAELGLNLSTVAASPQAQRSAARAKSWRDRVLDVAIERRVPLVRQAVAAIVNNLERRDWIYIMHAIEGALGGDCEAEDIFLEFSRRRVDGTSDPEEDERVWSTRGEGKAGYGDLLALLGKQRSPEAEAAIFAIQQEGAKRFPPLTGGEGAPGGPDNPEDDESDDDALLARRAPRIDPRAFYGLLDKIVTETTRESEATKIGVAAQILAHVSLALRPFYSPLGDARIPFNLYVIQVGPSGTGRKGTSAAIADGYLGPALRRLAGRVQARITFTDADEIARDEAQAEVEATDRKLKWARGVTGLHEIEIEIELDRLRADRAACAQEIAERTSHLRSKAFAPDTVRKHEKMIAAAQAKHDNLAALIAASETELAEVKAILKDPTAAVARAKTDHDAAEAKLNGLPPSALPPEPWLALFAGLAEPPMAVAGIGSGEGLIHAIRDPGRTLGPRGPVDDPGVANKRLFINMDEFGSVLAVIVRPGSTLSSTMRTLWDCRPTGATTKNSPVHCEEPFTTLSASITPGELMGRLFDKRDAASTADNGFGNRLLYLWVQRDRLVAHPQPTPGLEAMMDEIAANIFRVYEALKPVGGFQSTPIEFSAAAHARYPIEYKRVATLTAAGPNAPSSPSAWRSIFAKSQRSSPSSTASTRSRKRRSKLQRRGSSTRRERSTPSRPPPPNAGGPGFCPKTARQSSRR